MRPVMQCLGFGSADEDGKIVLPRRRAEVRTVVIRVVTTTTTTTFQTWNPCIHRVGRITNGRTFSHRSSAYHALEKFDKYIQPWIMSEPPSSPNRMLRSSTSTANNNNNNGNGNGSHPNTPSRVRKGKSSISAPPRGLPRRETSPRATFPGER